MEVTPFVTAFLYYNSTTKTNIISELPAHLSNRAKQQLDE
jgi:hypothetical protein